MPGSPTDLYAWAVVCAFGLSALTGLRSERAARAGASVAWTLFAGFWLVMAPHFALVERSYIEGVLSVLAVPACLYVAYLVRERRPNLLVLTRAVAIMGLLYMPFQTVPVLQEVAIETVTRQVVAIIAALGYRPEVVAGDAGHLNTVILTAPDGHRYATPVLLACTGVGSTAIVAGLVLAVGGSLRRKARALAVAVPVIYGLNLVRITFIVLAHAEQWFRVRPLTGVVMTMFGTGDPKLVSYYFADKVLAQSLSVLALVCIGWAVVRAVPELSVVLEELGYLLTGEEYDLREAFARFN